MVSRTKGHRRLDQQTDLVRWQLIFVMAAIDKEPSSLDRCQFAAHVRNPINLRHLGHDKFTRGMHRRQQRKACLVRFFGEIARHLIEPRSVLDLERANAGWFGDQVFTGRSQTVGLVLGFDGTNGGIGQVGHCLLGWRGQARLKNGFMSFGRMPRDQQGQSK